MADNAPRKTGLYERPRGGKGLMIGIVVLLALIVLAIIFFFESACGSRRARGEREVCRHCPQPWWAARMAGAGRCSRPHAMTARMGACHGRVEHHAWCPRP